MVKTILILAFLVMMGFILVNRQRVFIRDPLATVYRNEVRQSGVQVYINYSNDILLDQDFADRPTTRVLVQNWNLLPGTPARLTCVHSMACMTGDDHAVTNPIVRSGKGKYDPKVNMTGREINFIDGDGFRVRVELR